ncbi:hypothetical protein F0344_19915 [Streptomyces finlayi]|uniref:Uncharacterized protein n=1 Tax=Streptomyces finlayi TaxID=67296 RepID=A0A7G7BMM4_9ACTN|nr:MULTISPECIES: hypothetical protein [Streptomyces]MCY0952762.1 hypothetical protein [Streptomyces sp. H27-S2]QNE76589.1 hypothetical protein F0344_19915 [Streptomyces finlayi]
MPEYPLRCDVRRTESTTDLLGHLHRSEPGFAPYLLTAWSPELTAQETVVLPHLASLLDEPVALRKPRSGHTASRRLTWHCAIRNTTDVELDDDDWFELTREVLDATGIEPDADPAACRWVAMRNQASGLDIVATVIRQDGRWARLHNDAYFARAACANFTYDHGLDVPG